MYTKNSGSLDNFPDQQQFFFMGLVEKIFSPTHIPLVAIIKILLIDYIRMGY